MGFYERYILPPLLNAACNAPAIERMRTRVTPRASGVVLELGFGSGLNVPHYDPARVERLIGLDPSAGMLARGRKAAAAAPFAVEILPARAEDLDLPPASVDTVLVTFSLCSIPDPVSALAGARRALKPEGRLIFCEHGLAPDEKVSRAQRRITPVWKVIGGGCRLDRDMPRIIQDAGFALSDLQTRYLPKTPRWAGYVFWGEARPA
ncbi:MAG TPA: class I SAM-dependent methyltransferase [Caulobacteraceae bacterium]|nr:class I SAM-dependent methyltransferase [Caulobacteraceae bacterium]